jgi:hypothetical protein
MKLKLTYNLKLLTTQTLLMSAIQARVLQRGSGKNISTTYNTPLPSRLLGSLFILGAE